MVDIMNDTRGGSKTPWHLWVVGVVGLLWNGFGGYDYTMTKTRGVAYLSEMGMTQPQIDYFMAMPTWTTVPWALGVWGAIAGTLLLLARSRFAFPVFLVSLAGLLASFVYSYGLSNGAEVMGQTGTIMNGVILAGCLFFVWYSRMMAKRGVLR